MSLFDTQSTHSQWFNHILKKKTGFVDDAILQLIYKIAVFEICALTKTAWGESIQKNKAIIEIRQVSINLCFKDFIYVIMK